MGKEKILLRSMVLLKLALPFILVHSAYELHRDEFLYLEQGRHLSLGYLENPPMIALLAFISNIFGGGYFMVKLWPALFGAATLWLTILMVKEMGGRFYAQLLAGLGILFTAYLRIHFLFQPNILDIFSWTLGAYFLVRYIHTRDDRFIIYLAIALALGWYSKYSILFFIVGLALAMLLTHHRQLIFRKKFWMALLLFFVLISPNLIWQYVHNWPLVHHMNELQETQLQHLNRADFLKEQLLMLLPVAFLWIGGFIWVLRQRPLRIIGLCFLFIIFLIMMGSGKGYYALGAYPMLLAAGGVWAERISLHRKWVRFAFVVLILLLSIPFIPVLLPIVKPTEIAELNKVMNLDKAGLLRWEDGKDHPLQQDYADMLGWKELAGKAENFYLQLPPDKKTNTIIFAENYGLAGALKYFGSNPGFKQKTITDNGSFLFWIPANLDFEHILYLTPSLPAKDDLVFQQFQTQTIIDSCTQPLSRQYGTKIIFYQNASDSLSILAKKALDARRDRFR